MNAEHCNNATVVIDCKKVAVGTVNNKGVLTLFEEYNELYYLLSELGPFEGGETRGETIRCFYLPEVSKTVLQLGTSTEGFLHIESHSKEPRLPVEQVSPNSFVISYPELLTKMSWKSDKNVTLMFMTRPFNLDPKTSYYDVNMVYPMINTDYSLAIQSGNEGVLEFQDYSSEVYIYASNECKVSLEIKVVNPLEYKIQPLTKGVKLPYYSIIDGKQTPVTYSLLTNETTMQYQAYPNFKHLASMIKETFMYYSKERPVIELKRDYSAGENGFQIFHNIAFGSTSGGWRINVNDGKKPVEDQYGNTIKTQVLMKNTLSNGHGIRIPTIPPDYDLFVTCTLLFEQVNGKTPNNVSMLLKGQYGGVFKRYPLIPCKETSNIISGNSIKNKLLYFSIRFRLDRSEKTQEYTLWVGVPKGTPGKLPDDARVSIMTTFVRTTDQPVFNAWDPYERVFRYVRPNDPPIQIDNLRTYVKALLIGAGGGGGSYLIAQDKNGVVVVIKYGGGGGRGEYKILDLQMSTIIDEDRYVSGALLPLFKVGAKSSPQNKEGSTAMYLGKTKYECEGGNPGGINGGVRSGGGGFLNQYTDQTFGAGGSGDGQGEDGKPAEEKKGGDGGKCNIDPAELPFSVRPTEGGKGSNFIPGVSLGGSGGGGGGIYVSDLNENFGAGGNGCNSETNVSENFGKNGVVCLSYQYVKW